MRKWEPCVVTWRDAVTVSSSSSCDNFEPVTRRSIGFFIRRNAESITIAGEDDRKASLGGSDCDSVTTIPSGMIVAVDALIEKPARRKT